MSDKRDSPIEWQALLADRSWLQRLSRSLARDAHEADDVVQDASLAALRAGRVRHDNVRDARSWFSGVLRNRARRIQRGSDRRARREANRPRADSEPSTDEVLERIECQRVILEEVTRLPEAYRDVVLARFFEGRSLAEFARSARLADSTVRTRQKRALERLRDRLSKRFGTRLLPSLLLAGGGRDGLSSTLAPWLHSTASVATTTTTILMKWTLALGLVFAGLGGLWSWNVLVSRLDGATSARPDDAPALSEEPERSEFGQDDARRSAWASDTRVSIPTAPAPEADSADVLRSEPVPGGDTLSAYLDRVSSSFLTPQPDLMEANALVGRLLEEAVILDDSIERDEELGTVEGTIALGDSGLEASFRSERGSVRIELQSRAASEDFFMRDITWGFQDAGTHAEGAWGGIQFHPDSHRKSSELLGPDEERFVGWSYGVDTAGTRAEPITMRRAAFGAGFRIGRMEESEPIREDGLYDTSAWDGWQRLMAPHLR